jgi:MFS family permease
MTTGFAAARLVCMTSTTVSHPVPTSTTSRSWIELAATAWSALAAALGAWWLAVPDAYPDHLDGPTGDGSLVSLIEPTLVSSVVLALGIVGVLAGSTAGRRDTGGSRWLVPLGAAYAVVFGLLATDLSILVSFGYSTAILGPPLLFGYLVLASVHRPSMRWVVGGLAVSAVAIATTAGLETFADFGRGLGEGLERSGIGMLVVLGSFIGGALWLLVALRASGMPRAQASTATSWVPPRHDWGWWATVIAALSPLPYALLRMTWLTPWPTIVDAETLAEQPALRIFGLSLGFAAIGGSLLTAGLVMRWGSVYPRWIPVVGGRTVSPTWPTVFALVVGISVTVAGRSMVQMAMIDDQMEIGTAETFLVLPFPVWGPALIAAAIAYYRRRTTTVRTSRDRNVSVV